MPSVDQIEEWLGEDVTDSEGERIGKLDEVYYSARGGEAVFASIKSGLLGRRSNLVPLAGASVGRDYLRLGYSAEQIEGAGSNVAPEGTLDRVDARRLAELYGTPIAEDEDFEAASSIKARERASEEAIRRAEQLERESGERSADAQDARAAAEEADRVARERADAAQAASVEAERARAEAERPY